MLLAATSGKQRHKGSPKPFILKDYLIHNQLALRNDVYFKVQIPIRYKVYITLVVPGSGNKNVS